MEEIRHIADLRESLLKARFTTSSIGLVPTMGALHKGHIALVEASVRENDKTIVSLFVNPTQFDQKQDYDQYPTSYQQDIEMLKAASVDFVFSPNKEEMYPFEPAVEIQFSHLDTLMEGQYRSGHFNGVGLIVSKLFNLIRPERAYFGQKDLQQFHVIKRLNDELMFGIDLKLIPIVREKSGLALSSRNRRLSKSGLLIASQLYNVLILASEHLTKTNDLAATREFVLAFLRGHSEIELEYFEIVNARDFTNSRELHSGKNELALCIACYVEGIRLIDNHLLTLQGR